MRKPCYILGINAYHADAAACILKDGQLVAAAEEERFRRVKHWAGFPAEAIRYCLTAAGISLSRVDHAAINRSPRANLGRKIRYVLKKRPDVHLILNRLKNAGAWARAGQTLSTVIPGETFTGKTHHVEHHEAHLASAFLVSPFKKALVLSLDGFGDFASTAWGTGYGSTLRVAGKIFFPHSLGAFYQTVTQHLGFPNYGDEYKVMGLSAYGRPAYTKQLKDVLRLHRDGSYRLNLKYFTFHRRDYRYRWDNGAPVFAPQFSDHLTHLLGPARRSDEPITQRHKDIARSTQSLFESALFRLIRQLHAQYGWRNLALAGGCAMNSVAVGKIKTHTPVEQVYVQPNAGDGGGALGAACAVWHGIGNHGREFVMAHALWGPAYDDSALKACLQHNAGRLSGIGCRITSAETDSELCGQTAGHVAAGRVVGWFQNRMEWGPRALGARSILADPRTPDIRDLLNRKIKRRETFRPFAPSILHEAVGDWFAEPDDVPFMTHVLTVKQDKRPFIPAVVHADGTGRLQTVREAEHPLYYGMIREFNSLTGIPMVLNTSFNENEPIVRTPQEAMDCFLRTGMDVLVMGRHIIQRGPS